MDSTSGELTNFWLIMEYVSLSPPLTHTTPPSPFGHSLLPFISLSLFRLSLPSSPNQPQRHLPPQPFAGIVGHGQGSPERHREPPWSARFPRRFNHAVTSLSLDRSAAVRSRAAVSRRCRAPRVDVLVSSTTRSPRSEFNA